MREITFNWNGATVRLVPSLALLQRIASEVRRATDGQETTVSLAHKCVQGGLEPMFMLIPLIAFLREGLRDECPSEDEIARHAMANIPDVMTFRLAYVQAVLPHVDLGKAPAAPSAPVGVAEKPKAPGKVKKVVGKKR